MPQIYSTFHCLTQKAASGCLRVPPASSSPPWPELPSQGIPCPQALSPAKVLLRTDSCSASSLLLLLGFPLFSPPTRLFLFLTAPITFTAAIKRTEKFCHCIELEILSKAAERILFLSTPVTERRKTDPLLYRRFMYINCTQTWQKPHSALVWLHMGNSPKSLPRLLHSFQPGSPGARSTQPSPRPPSSPPELCHPKALTETAITPGW